MKRGRLPLTALRSFEAAGRHVSFKAAAEELFVSPAAISRQIRDLERSLGVPLFERGHRAVTLTQHGKQLLSDVTIAFDSMSLALQRVAEGDGQASLTVSVEAAFASAWLGPHLPDFQRLHPDIDVTIDSNDRVIDFSTDAADLAIRYGRSRRRWPRCQSRHLAEVMMTPVIAPTLLADGPVVSRADDILAYPLIHEDSRDSWSDWFKAAAIERAVPRQGPVFTDHMLVLQSAVRGTGVALADNILAREALRAGTLVKPVDISAHYGAYWLVARNFETLSKAATTFAAWLEATLGADLSGTPNAD